MSNSFATSWTIACQASLSMRFPRQKHWSDLPFPSQPRNWTCVSCISRGMLYHWATREAWCTSSVQSLSRVHLFATPWIAARQASLSIINSRSSLSLMSIESVMSSSHLVLCCPLFLLPPIPPSIRVFSNQSTLHMRWPKYWSFSFSIIPSKEIPGLISFRMDWLDLLYMLDNAKSFFVRLYQLIPLSTAYKCSCFPYYSLSHCYGWSLILPFFMGV